MDKISIITTFYNAQTFIGNAIASVLGQKVPDGCEIEYVLVDDKSQDNSRNIVENIISNTSKENFKFKLVEPENNLGCGGARKFGIENATGNYFMFLDADDYYIHLDFVENAYNTITSENADVVEYGVIYNQQNGQQSNSTAPQKIVLTSSNVLRVEYG